MTIVKTKTPTPRSLNAWRCALGDIVDIYETSEVVDTTEEADARDVIEAAICYCEPKNMEDVLVVLCCAASFADVMHSSEPSHNFNRYAGRIDAALRNCLNYLQGVSREDGQ